MESATSPNTVRPRMPRRSILTRPRASTESRSSWVMVMPLLPERMTGTRSVSAGATTTPPGCTERWRGSPNRLSAAAYTRLYCGWEDLISENAEWGSASSLLLAAGKKGVRQGGAQLANDLRFQAQCPGSIGEGRTWPKAVDGAHHGHALFAIYIKDMFDDLVPPPRTQIGVDIGGCGARRVEETLEIQVERQRIGAGDAQAMRHQGRGRRATRGIGHTLLAGKIEQLLHDQEDRFKAPLSDDGKLMFEAPADWRGNFTIEVPGALFGFLAQVLGGGEPTGRGTLGICGMPRGRRARQRAAISSVAARAEGKS